MECSWERMVPAWLLGGRCLRFESLGCARIEEVLYVIAEFEALQKKMELLLRLVEFEASQKVVMKIPLEKL
jgi:hypothetical protein